jgi:putative folate metabolism gamma-glutamate ligase
MNITPLRTDIVLPGSVSLTALLDAHLEHMDERSILAITSKIVSLCENNVVPKDSISKDELVRQQSAYYLPGSFSKYGYQFTIINSVLVPTAGIDESNGDGDYILWPKNVQQTANDVRAYLAGRFGLKHVGVVITDSTSAPLRRGTYGIALAHSGFSALNSYVGKPDLFGRPYAVSQSNVIAGLAAGAVVTMGEGAEQTPLALVSDVPFVTFQNRNPNTEELAELRISREEDLFAPFLENVEWHRGGQA